MRKVRLGNPKWNFSRYHEEVDMFVFSKPENVRVIEKEGMLDVDNMKLEILFVPGHDPSCLAFHIGNDLYTGDAYIPGVKVVTTFPRSNKQHAADSMVRLQELEHSGLNVKQGHWIE